MAQGDVVPTLYAPQVHKAGAPPSRDSKILAERTQDLVQATADQNIHNRKEHGCEGRKDKDHHSGQHHFAARGPDNFGNFGAHLLKKLKRIGDGHVWNPC